jgi:CRISPR-associated endonuclease Csn1
MNNSLRYRLALDLGSTSLGWAMLKLNEQFEPTAIIKAGVRIFSDGREAAAPGKLGTSLAAKRREKRSMRRRRDRYLRRRRAMLDALVKYGFFPEDTQEQKLLERENPYELRANGLHQQLSLAQFGRALFHLNQRRGFKSNRKTDKKDGDNSAQDKAISQVEKDMCATQCKTVGEYLWRRMQSGKPGENTVRARHNNMISSKRAYDLYINRAMVATEFDLLWSSQKKFWENQNPTQSSPFTDTAKTNLRDKILLFQRKLKPVQPGRCTLFPEEPRAPLALPSVQRFRIYQEINNLKYFEPGDLEGKALSKEQRDRLFTALERAEKEKKGSHTVSFAAIKTMFGWDRAVKINLEDPKREDLKGNSTSTELSKKNNFGLKWYDFDNEFQDEIVKQLLNEENETILLAWLKSFCDVTDAQALSIARTSLIPGYGSLSIKAINSLVPILRESIIKYHEAVEKAGFGSHSLLDWNYEDNEVTHWLSPSTGEIRLSRPSASENRLFSPVFKRLPYYGKPLKRHVAFADPKAKQTDSEEKYFGKIANPTVHIGLNQTRKVVNALIERYGRPTQIVVEVSRELKQNEEQRAKTIKDQAANKARNDVYRKQIAEILSINEHDVTRTQIQKLILWNELSGSPLEKLCPYSGKVISPLTLLRPDSPIEIEHILPFSQTLDDSLNNKTVAFREANQLKGNRSPWDARESFNSQGGEWLYEKIAARVAEMLPAKSYRFSETAMQQWLRDPKNDFLARNLNDTKYLSRIAREYMSLLCPVGNTWVVPGTLTGLIRHDLGLDSILGVKGKKNRNDHRHHAVDACVIGVMSRSSLKKFADANTIGSEARSRLIRAFEAPWTSFRNHVSRAIDQIKVSYKPDHGHEAAMMDETTYRPPHLDPKGKWRTQGIGGNKPNERDPSTSMIAIARMVPGRHLVNENGQPLPYKGYLGGSNYCFEITRSETGKWVGQVITTFQAYQIMREQGISRLRHENLGQNGKPLILRATKDDCLRINMNGTTYAVRVVKMRADRHLLTLGGLQEANLDARVKAKEDELLYMEDQSANTLRQLEARRVTISPIGELRDPGFKG